MAQQSAVVSLDRISHIRREAISLSQQVVSADLKVIQDIQRGAIEKGLDPIYTSLDRINLIRSCWSIVDRIDAIRQLLRGFQLKPNEIRDTAFKTARKMRNEMDHLGPNLQNISKLKHAYPVYGIMLYQRSRPDDILFDESGNAWLQQISYDCVGLAETPDNFSVRLDFSSQTYSSPIGDTFLLAFNQRLNLTRAVSAAEQVEQMMIEMDENTELQIKDHLSKKNLKLSFVKKQHGALNLSVNAVFQQPEPLDTAIAKSMLNHCIPQAAK